MSVNRKRLIVDAATKSFSQFGYKATTMDQVAKVASVGKGTIYTFYSNKEELFKEIVQELIQEMKHEAEDSIVLGLPFSENLHRALFRILEFRSEHQLMIKLMQEREIGTPAVMEMMVEVEAEIVGYVREKLESAIQEGHVRPCDTELTAFIMFKMYIALIFDWEKNHSPLAKEELANLFQMYFFNGLSS